METVARGDAPVRGWKAIQPKWKEELADVIDVKKALDQKEASTPTSLGLLAASGSYPELPLPGLLAFGGQKTVDMVGHYFVWKAGGVSKSHRLANPFPIPEKIVNHPGAFTKSIVTGHNSAVDPFLNGYIKAQPVPQRFRLHQSFVDAESFIGKLIAAFLSFFNSAGLSFDVVIPAGFDRQSIIRRVKAILDFDGTARVDRRVDIDSDVSDATNQLLSVPDNTDGSAATAVLVLSGSPGIDPTQGEAWRNDNRPLNLAVGGKLDTASDRLEVRGALGAQIVQFGETRDKDTIDLITEYIYTPFEVFEITRLMLRAFLEEVVNVERRKAYHRRKGNTAEKALRDLEQIQFPGIEGDDREFTLDDYMIHPAFQLVIELILREIEKNFRPTSRGSELAFHFAQTRDDEIHWNTKNMAERFKQLRLGHSHLSLLPDQYFSHLNGANLFMVSKIPNKQVIIEEWKDSKKPVPLEEGEVEVTVAYGDQVIDRKSYEEASIGIHVGRAKTAEGTKTDNVVVARNEKGEDRTYVKATAQGLVNLKDAVGKPYGEFAFNMAPDSNGNWDWRSINQLDEMAGNRPIEDVYREQSIYRWGILAALVFLVMGVGFAFALGGFDGSPLVGSTALAYSHFLVGVKKESPKENPFDPMTNRIVSNLSQPSLNLRIGPSLEGRMEIVQLLHQEGETPRQLRQVFTHQIQSELGEVYTRDAARQTIHTFATYVDKEYTRENLSRPESIVKKIPMDVVIVDEMMGRQLYQVLESTLGKSDEKVQVAFMATNAHLAKRLKTLVRNRAPVFSSTHLINEFPGGAKIHLHTVDKLLPPHVRSNSAYDIRLLAPARYSLDPTGLAMDSPLTQARFVLLRIINETLKAIHLNFEDVLNMEQATARLMKEQA